MSAIVEASTRAITANIPEQLARELEEKCLLTDAFVAWALELGIREGKVIEHMIADEIAEYRAEKRTLAGRR